jgi:hypothetical protein
MTDARSALCVTLAVDPARLFQDLLPWLLGLIGIVVVGAGVMYVVHRMFRSEESGPTDGFSLQDLRDLHANGELTDEEFARARTAIIGRTRQAAPPSKPGPSAIGPGKPPPA